MTGGVRGHEDIAMPPRGASEKQEPTPPRGGGGEADRIGVYSGRASLVLQPAKGGKRRGGSCGPLGAPTASEVR